MTTRAMRYAATIGLAGALVLAAVVSAAVEVNAGARDGQVLAQYCAPQHDYSDLHRVYCRDHG
jgi:hypothetical protein